MILKNDFVPKPIFCVLILRRTKVSLNFLFAELRERPWSTLVEGGKERYRPPGKLTLELVLANQKK